MEKPEAGGRKGSVVLPIKIKPKVNGCIKRIDVIKINKLTVYLLITFWREIHNDPDV